MFIMMAEKPFLAVSVSGHKVELHVCDNLRNPWISFEDVLTHVCFFSCGISAHLLHDTPKRIVRRSPRTQQPRYS